MEAERYVGLDASKRIRAWDWERVRAIEKPRAHKHGERKKMGKNSDLSDFERGMVVGARRAGQSVSETGHLLGFSRTTISRVYREWSEKEKISSERQFCGRKCLVDSRGQRRMARLVQSDRNATVTQITSRYNRGVHKSISERTTRRALKQMGYRKQFARAQRNSAIKDGENGDSEPGKTLSEESQFLQQYSDEGHILQTETESSGTNLEVKSRSP